MPIDVYYAALAYNANHGAGAPATQTQSAGEPGYAISFTISSSRPSRTYYTFLGWSTNQSATSASYAPGGSITVNSSTTVGGTNTKTLYAVWRIQTAYVYYNANGGSGAPATQSHNAGTRITLSSTVPTRSGYRFLGWATSASATTAQYQPNTSQALYTTTTLYAVWQVAASTLTASNGTLGTAMTIGITRYVNTYTDTITYKFGSATGTIVTKTNNASVSWTPPTTLAQQIPNASSGTVTFTCSTYNGNTLLGTSTKSVTLTVPNSLAPTVSVSYADTISQCLTWGLLVQSRSKLAFSITASGQQGATIASYSTSVNGTSYNSASFTTDVLLYNGTNTYTVTVTDSRGLQTVSTGTFSVVAYSNPSLTLTLCDRNDSDSEQVDIGFDFAVSPVSNNNDAKYRIDYKLKSASTWTNGTVQNLGAYSGSISDLIASLDGGDEWDIRINVIDSFQTSSVESEVGVSGNILLNSRHNGGLGLLMKSQADNQLDIGKPTVHHGAVLEQFGSTVTSHSASGNYAKVVTFGANVTTGKNLAPTNSYNTSRVYWGTNINSANILGQVLQTLPAGTYTLSWKHTMTAVASATFQTGSYIRYYDGSSWHILAAYSINTQGSCAVNDVFEISRTITIGESDVGQNFEVLAYCGQDSGFKSTISEYQIEVGSQKTPFEPYVDITNMAIDAPVTMEYIRSSDETKTELTIVFNPDYSLSSFKSNNFADAYLHRSSASVWDLYIGKNNSSDSVEILDFHNPWSNTDMTVEWEDTSVSTLPTGAVSAVPVNTVIDASPSGVSVSSGSWTTTASITLPRGIWILSGYVQFGSNSSGIRSTVLSASQNDGTATRGMSSDLNNNTGNNSGKLHFFDVYQIASQTTYYLNAYQNSGSAITTYGRITAIKIV